MKVQAGRPPPRHAPCWVTSIWQRLFPDKACSDVWVFGARWWKMGKACAAPQALFSFPASELLPPDGFSFSSPSRQTVPRVRPEHKHRWDARSWQVDSQTAGHGRGTLGPKCGRRWWRGGVRRRNCSSCGYEGKESDGNPDTNINTGQHFNDSSLWFSAFPSTS